jgi:amphiphysin
MQKTGQVERTVDHEFADEESKFKVYVWLGSSLRHLDDLLAGSFEKETNQLQKDSKTFIDSLKGKYEVKAYLLYYNSALLAMSAAQSRLAGTIDTFYAAATERNSEGVMATNAYKRAADEFDAAVAKEFVSLDNTPFGLL